LNVGRSWTDATWPILVWPSSSRCATAASAPPSESSRTDGCPRLSDSITTIGSEPAAHFGGSTSNSSSPSAGPACSASADAAPQSRSLSVSISATAYPAARAAVCAPRSRPPKNGFVMSGTTSTIVRAAPVFSARAAALGR
jgi:hypothetical protein